MPLQHCPVCQHNLDAASLALSTEENDTSRPHPGDFSVCIECGTILIFNTDMSVREPTLTELLDLDREHEQMLSKAQNVIRSYGKDKP